MSIHSPIIPGFSEYAIQRRLGLQIREFVDPYSIQHELRKRILQRFREEGIRNPAGETMPVPDGSRGTET